MIELTEGILSTHLHSQGEFAEELSLIGPNLQIVGCRNNRANKSGTSYFPFMNG